MQQQKHKLTSEEMRAAAQDRARELKESIKDYLEVRDSIPTGTNQSKRLMSQKVRILSALGATETDWNNWKWQIRNRITEVKTLAQIIELAPEATAQIQKAGHKFRWAISPYYASLMDPLMPTCPVRLQSLPGIQELDDEYGIMDPMAEELTSPAPCITRRYPDRLIINVTNQCAMYCRHCQRRRNIGEVDQNMPISKLKEALSYIRKNQEIRDVLITGGDPLMLSNSNLDWLLSELDTISHVEIKRIGTRTLVTLPQRITDELCNVLSKHHPLFINTQFNHPLEITPEAVAACAKLSQAGIPLGNQAVLLAGVNADYDVMKKLNHELLKARVRPYYIFHAKNVKGTSHFGTSIETGMEIMDKLRGYTSGLAVPTYIINAPHGQGKTPVAPEYLLSLNSEKAVLRTWEKRILEYPNEK